MVSFIQSLKLTVAQRMKIFYTAVNIIWNLGTHEKIILERILKEQIWREWTGSIWLRTETSGGLLGTW